MLPFLGGCGNAICPITLLLVPVDLVCQFFSDYALFRGSVMHKLFANYAAPSGPGMPIFLRIHPLPWICYALNFSNYAAPSGPGMPIFSPNTPSSMDLLCTTFFQLHLMFYLLRQVICFRTFTY